MSADKPDDTRSHETDFAAMWSSDGVTRSIGPTATGLPVDLPFLFGSGQQFGPYRIVRPIGKGGMGQVRRRASETFVLAVFIAGAMWAALHPARGIQDRIAGTWIVPR